MEDNSGKFGRNPLIVSIPVDIGTQRPADFQFVNNLTPLTLLTLLTLLTFSR